MDKGDDVGSDNDFLWFVRPTSASSRTLASPLAASPDFRVLASSSVNSLLAGLHTAQVAESWISGSQPAGSRSLGGWCSWRGLLDLICWGGSCLWIPGPGLSPLHSSPLRTPTRRLSRLLLLGFPPLWTLCLLRVAGLHTAQGHRVVGIWVAACWVSGSRPAGSWSSGQCGVYCGVLSSCGFEG